MSENQRRKATKERRKEKIKKTTSTPFPPRPAHDTEGGCTFNNYAPSTMLLSPSSRRPLLLSNSTEHAAQLPGPGVRGPITTYQRHPPALAGRTRRCTPTDQHHSKEGEVGFADPRLSPLLVCYLWPAEYFAHGCNDGNDGIAVRYAPWTDC